MRNWLRNIYQKRLESIKLKRICKDVAYKIKDLWYCPDCKTENSIRISKRKNYIRIFCQASSCNFQYRIEPNEPEKLKHEYLENISYSLEELNRLRKDTFNPDVIKGKSIGFPYSYEDFVLYPDEKILESSECWYYDENNFNEHAKEGNLLLTTKRLVLCFNESYWSYEKEAFFTAQKVKDIFKVINSFRENKILVFLLAVITGLLGLRNFIDINNFQQILLEKTGINFTTIVIWMNRLQYLVFENSSGIILFLDFYIFWLIVASLIWGYKDLKLTNRVLSFIKSLPHFRYFIFVIIIFQISSVKSAWELMILSPFFFFVFIMLWEFLRYILFQIEWYILKEQEIPFDCKKFKEISLGDFRVVSFNRVYSGPAIDKPTEKRPSIEIYYKNGETISRIILRLIVENPMLGKDFSEKMGYRLLNYHAMKSFVEKAGYYAIKENCQNK